ncbi:MAG: pentapeptide repeat-containing protein [Nodosilinea sp.]
MAQISHRQPITAQVSAAVEERRSTQRSLALRRLLAWGLEVSLLVSSAALPWALGELVRRHSEAEPVPLNPVSSLVQTGLARPLGLSRSYRVAAVPPLTNLLWFGALVMPLAFAGSQLQGLARTGKTWPKAWLKLQVVGLDRPVPGYRAILWREGIGRWGLPWVVAYGLWLGGGAYPDLVGLGVLALGCGLGEGLTGQTNRSRRAWHDYLGSTRVVLRRGGEVAVTYHPAAEQLTGSAEAEPLATQENDILPFTQAQILTITEEFGGLTAIVLSPADAAQGIAKPKGWRHYATLPKLGGLAGIVALVGVGGLLLSRGLHSREAVSGQQQDELFLALVENLSLNATSFTDRQAAALALASTADPRAITLLVDMLAQTDDPTLRDTLQQALMTLGPAAIPALQRLNLTLANDSMALPPEPRVRAQLRQRTVKHTLANILVLHSGHLNGVDLSDTNLSTVVEGPDTFTLVLEQQHLAGILWRNAVLSGARLRKASLFDPGADGRTDTFDDWITDFSGSDLTEASLVAAQLRHTSFRHASLLRTNLSNAQAPYADFSGANASSAWLIEADVSHGNFNGTSLVGADLTNAQLIQASFVEARLKQAYLVGATLAKADLTRADLSDADLTRAGLSGARLVEANLTHSRLEDADLNGANLTNANLQNANLQGIALAGANLARANFDGATFFAAEVNPADGFIATIAEPAPTSALVGVDFSEALNLDADQLRYICNQGGTHPACAGKL